MFHLLTHHLVVLEIAVEKLVIFMKKGVSLSFRPIHNLKERQNINLNLKPNSFLA